MKALSLLFSLLMSAVIYAQHLNPPQIETPTLRVYMSPSGDDVNVGDSLNPVATFSTALDRLVANSSMLTGEVYAEVVLFIGTFHQALVQPIDKYALPNRFLNVSVRGKSFLSQLNGTNLSNLNSGSGMIHLLGSHIKVSDLTIINSPANGIRFGFNTNNTVVNSSAIIIERVYISGTLGHGILMGIGAVDNSNPTALVPKAVGFMVNDSYVTESVNYNTPQPQWGSAIKGWNAKNILVKNCHVTSNGGEGIDADDCDSIEIYKNIVKDNVVGIYLDKVKTAWVYSNYIENNYKKAPGILCAMEAFTNLISNYYIKDVHIVNNILLNTQGIGFWQGTYSALQNGYFEQVEIAHNSIIGRQTGNGACISFSFETFLGQPAPNVHFNQIGIHRNLVSAHPDSLNNNQLIISPCVIPSYTANYNCYGQAVWSGMTSPTDIIDPTIPTSVPDAWGTVSGGSYVPLHVVPTSSIQLDYNFIQRDATQTAVGALEYFTAEVDDNLKEAIVVYPNPFNNHIRLNAPSEIKVLGVFDMAGKMVTYHTIDPNAAQKILSFELLEPGAYIIQFSNGIARPIIKVE